MGIETRTGVKEKLLEGDSTNCEEIDLENDNDGDKVEDREETWDPCKSG
jgi:hypothetical protein